MERVLSILGVSSGKHVAPPEQFTNDTLSSTAASRTAPPPPPKPSGPREKRDEVHANIFAKKLNIAILGDAVKSDSSDEDEL